MVFVLKSELYVVVSSSSLPIDTYTLFIIALSKNANLSSISSVLKGLLYLDSVIEK